MSQADESQTKAEAEASASPRPSDAAVADTKEERESRILAAASAFRLPTPRGAVRVALIALVISGLSLAALILMSADPVSPVTDLPVDPDPSKATLLASTELVKAAQAAEQTGDLAAARGNYKKALEPLGDGQVAERLAIYERLAFIEGEIGDPRTTTYYRDYAQRLRKRLGGALEVYGKAEDALREGRHAASLMLFRRFLLRDAELEGAARVFLERARRRIAHIWRLRVESEVKPAALGTEPSEWFDEK